MHFCVKPAWSISVLYVASFCGCWRRRWQPIQCSCLENPVGRGAWWATVHGSQESDTPERLNRRQLLCAAVIRGHMKTLFLKPISRPPSRSSSPAFWSGHPGVASPLPFSPGRAAPPAAWPGLSGAWLPQMERRALCGCQSWTSQHGGS